MRVIIQHMSLCRQGTNCKLNVLNLWTSHSSILRMSCDSSTSTLYVLFFMLKAARTYPECGSCCRELCTTDITHQQSDGDPKVQDWSGQTLSTARTWRSGSWMWQFGTDQNQENSTQRRGIPILKALKIISSLAASSNNNYLIYFLGLYLLYFSKFSFKIIIFK